MYFKWKQTLSVPWSYPPTAPLTDHFGACHLDLQLSILGTLGLKDLCAVEPTSAYMQGRLEVPGTNALGWQCSVNDCRELMINTSPPCFSREALCFPESSHGITLPLHTGCHCTIYQLPSLSCLASLPMFIEIIPQ